MLSKPATAALHSVSSPSTQHHLSPQLSSASSPASRNPFPTFKATKVRKKSLSYEVDGAFLSFRRGKPSYLGLASSRVVLILSAAGVCAASHFFPFASIPHAKLFTPTSLCIWPQTCPDCTLSSPSSLVSRPLSSSRPTCIASYSRRSAEQDVLCPPLSILALTDLPSLFDQLSSTSRQHVGHRHHPRSQERVQDQGY